MQYLFQNRNLYKLITKCFFTMYFEIALIWTLDNIFDGKWTLAQAMTSGNRIFPRTISPRFMSPYVVTFNCPFRWVDIIYLPVFLRFTSRAGTNPKYQCSCTEEYGFKRLLSEHDNAQTARKTSGTKLLSYNIYPIHHYPGVWVCVVF